MKDSINSERRFVRLYSLPPTTAVAIILVSLILASWIAPELVHASEGGGHVGAHHASIADLKWPWINFILYLVGMYFLLRGVVARGWKSRAERISHDASKSERELAAAAAILAAAKERQTKLSAEKTAIGRSLANEAQAEANNMIHEAELRAQEISKQSANRIVAEQNSALQSTKKRIAEKILNTAERKVRAGISAENDRKIRQNVSTSLTELKGL